MKAIPMGAAAAALALAACAPAPQSIVPVSMAGAYDGIGCARAAQMLAEERQALASLSAAQEDTRAGDAVGVFFLGIPLASAAGGDRSGQIAAAKGKILALEARLAGCRR